MPAIDTSDSPIKGFRIIVYHAGHDELYLRCRGKECPYFKRLPIVINLEVVISLAYEHRKSCTRPIQRAQTNDKLPIQIQPRPLTSDHA